MQNMLGNYRRLVLLNADSPDDGDWRETAERMASVFSLEKVEITGTHTWIERLLSGARDEDFLVITPGTEIELSMLLDM